MIHVAKKDLRMDNETYRAMLWTHGRVKSSADLDSHGRNKVIQHLRNIGWVPIKSKRNKKYSPKSRGSIADKARALWIDMFKHGLINDGSEKALSSFVKKMTGLDAVDFMNNDTRSANKVIEALKSMRQRLESKNGKA